jgi:hypothetical protein
VGAAEVIPREQLVEQSVTDYVREAIFGEYDYPTDKVELVESFDFSQSREGLTKNIIALGFSFDDGGTQAELGSALTTRVHTIEFFAFGLTNTWARNLANAVKHVMERDGRVPLRDYTRPGEADHRLAPDLRGPLGAAADRGPRAVAGVRVVDARPGGGRLRRESLVAVYQRIFVSRDAAQVHRLFARGPRARSAAGRPSRPRAPAAPAARARQVEIEPRTGATTRSCASSRRPRPATPSGGCARRSRTSGRARGSGTRTSRRC